MLKVIFYREYVTSKVKEYSSILVRIQINAASARKDKHAFSG